MFFFSSVFCIISTEKIVFLVRNSRIPKIGHVSKVHVTLTYNYDFFSGLGIDTPIPIF